MRDEQDRCEDLSEEMLAALGEQETAELDGESRSPEAESVPQLSGRGRR